MTMEINSDELKSLLQNYFGFINEIVGKKLEITTVDMNYTKCTIEFEERTNDEQSVVSRELP